MQNAITTLRIQNFKSIKDVTLTPRRVNIIIGEPNVGKSNILEAISLLGGMFFDKADGKFMDGQIRYQTIRNLFYDNDWSQEITVTGEGVGATRLRKKLEQVEVAFGDGNIRAKNPIEAIGIQLASDSARMNAALTGKHMDDNLTVNFEHINHFLGSFNKEGFSDNIQLSKPQPAIHSKKV